MIVFERELQNDYDKEFLLQGVKHGFDIIRNTGSLPSNVLAKNHPSASLNSPLYKKAHEQILNEIACGNYIFADQTPRIISPMAVIPKPDGGVRLIHDCSRPEGQAVNSLVDDVDKQRFQTLDEAAKLVTPNCFMAKVDLKTAYRSVKISKRSQQVTGFQWTFPDGETHILYDSKLPFGAKLAPLIFHRLSQSIRRMMSRRGFTIVAYLDDFFICEATKQRCLEALNTLIELLRQLGFMINWSKVVDPSTRLTFLGIEIDSISMQLKLPESKLSALKNDLALFSTRKRASKKQMQSLAGKLNWAAAVVHGGRVFLRRIIDAITQIKSQWHKTILSSEVKRDLKWWQDFLDFFNGKSLILDTTPLTSVCTDACKEGGGGFFEQDWFYAYWDTDYPMVKDFHINELEAFAVVLAAKRWCAQWENKRVVILSDNMTTVACLNKCTSRNKNMMKYLRHLFWLSAIFNFRIQAVHVPGKDNEVADKISRLNEPQSFYGFVGGCLPQPVYVQHLESHMSYLTLSSLLYRHSSIPANADSG